MTRKEHLLTILAEECNETAQRASKALRFSLEEIQPGQSLSNGARITEEFSDLCAMIEMLQDEKCLNAFWDRDRMELKKRQVEKFLLHSKANGTLTE